MSQHKPSNSSTTNHRGFLARFLALGEAEAQLAHDDARTRRELWLHATALLVCPLAFCLVVLQLAYNLFDYDWPASLLLAATTSFGLFLVDSHYLIQRRGTQANQLGRINKVRWLTLLVFITAASLMSAHTFRHDIDRVLATQRDAFRNQVAAQYAQRRKAAQQVLKQRQQAMLQQQNFTDKIAQLKVDQAKAMEQFHNEVEGNNTDGHKRVKGYGPKARGFEQKAQRIGLEIETRKAQRARIATPSDQTVQQAKQQLQTIEQQIDTAVADRTGGPLKRLQVLWTLVRDNFINGIVVILWMALGMMIETVMWFAQGRSENHLLLARARDIDVQAQQARLEQFYQQQRDKHSDSIEPINVQVTPDMADAETKTHSNIIIMPQPSQRGDSRDDN